MLNLLQFSLSKLPKWPCEGMTLSFGQNITIESTKLQHTYLSVIFNVMERNQHKIFIFVQCRERIVARLGDQVNTWQKIYPFKRNALIGGI